VIAGIELWEFTPEKQEFIWECIRGEKILPLFMWSVLKYNLEDIWLSWDVWELQMKY
jgi:hypothetical protein